MRTPHLLMLMLLTACGASRQARRLEGRYQTGDPGPGWTRVRPGGADRAWYSDDLHATIYTDSNCATRFEDRPLDKLADSALLGMSAGEPDLSETRTIDGREALVRRQSGVLDGVPFELGIAVLKKNECVYDFLLVSTPGGIDRAWDAFEAVLAGFQARG
ncbi:MAG: hypothetical protein D6798_01980 [Deltaproteobacteria bacterium]|nr:MAG: hypothetical protein D6798_01980 [Deltaproteobacteria bacterium]